MTHKCPHRQCTLQVSAARLACRPHWYMLPKDLREAVWNAYNSGDRLGHRQAVSAALTWYRENT